MMDMPNELERIVAIPCNNFVGSVLRRICVCVVVYFICQERNARIFRNEERNTGNLFESIIDTIKLRMVKLKG